ncbi:MAG: hypothetical protein GY866_14030 [Proteobacteria bacterium]|nr:hypothetical protein [Pseudomonadota bacterium]
MEYFKPPEFGREETEAAAELHELASEIDQEDQLSEAEQFELENIEVKQSGEKRKKIDYSQFNSSEFNEVDSLLTNVEDYSKRIRDDVDKYARQVREEVDLMKSEIELELAHTLIKKMEAEREAQAIVQSAEDLRDDSLNKGREEGFQAGFEDGSNRHKEENDLNTGNTLSVLKELQSLRLKIHQEYEQQIVQMSLLIAKKIVHGELKTDKAFVKQMLQDSMAHFEGMGSVRIKIHPSEYDFISTHQPELASFLDEDQIVKIKSDSNVQPASAVIESDFASVDLDLQRQFDEIQSKLQECFEDRRALFQM